MTLQTFFSALPGRRWPFPAGTDSALVLWAARQYGRDVRAYYGKTAFQPAFELADARRLAHELDVPMTVVELDVLSVPEAAANGPRRCYYCKRRCLPGCGRPPRRTVHVLLDGTNASDDAGDRPGMAALRELEVRSPLRECGVTKAQVRQLSRQAAGCSPGTSPPTPAWPPACPPARHHGGDAGPRGAGRKRAGGAGLCRFPVRLLDGCAACS